MTTFTVTPQFFGADVWLALAGELDLDTVEQFATAVGAVMQPPIAQVVVDVAKLTFCDSTGVQGLTNARVAADHGGVQFYVVNVEGFVRKVLQACGVLEYLSIPTSPSAHSTHLRHPSQFRAEINGNSTGSAGGNIL